MSKKDGKLDSYELGGVKLEDAELPEPEEDSVEDNLPLVNYIMLHRVYDLLLILCQAQDPEKTARLVELHTSGGFLGPTPSYSPEVIRK
jgi:hypothetical protein